MAKSHLNSIFLHSFLARHTTFIPGLSSFHHCCSPTTILPRFIHLRHNFLIVCWQEKKLLIVSSPQRLDASNSFQITQIIVNWRLTWARRAHGENWFSSTFLPSSFAGKSDFRFSTKSLSRIKWFMNELGSLFSCFVSFRLPLNGICRDES